MAITAPFLVRSSRSLYVITLFRPVEAEISLSLRSGEVEYQFTDVSEYVTNFSEPEANLVRIEKKKW